MTKHHTFGPDGKLYRKGDDGWLAQSSTYKSSMVGFHVWRASLDAGEFNIYH